MESCRFGYPGTDIRSGEGDAKATAAKATLIAAMCQIMIADVSMSIDNIIAGAAAAREHLVVMAIGLVLSIELMAVSASVIIKILERYTVLKWAGLAIIVYIACDMIIKTAMPFI